MTLARAIMVAAILALLASCQQLFTTSLGKAFARDGYDLAGISLEDALEYLAEAKANGDVQLAAALVSPLLSKADSTVGTTYDEAATALVSAVIISSGIGQAVNSGLDLITKNLTDGTDISLADVTRIIESVTISTTSVTALLLVANNPPPSMDATQAYTAAAALLLHIVENSSLTLESNISAFDALTGDNEVAYNAALALYNRATNELDGADTAFGKFFAALPFSES